MLTRWKLIRTDGVIKEFENEMSKDPGYELLRSIISPLIERGQLEHVYVWADFEHDGLKQSMTGHQLDWNFKALDMFVDENGHSQNLRRNEIATTIYRRATMEGRSSRPPPDNPETLDFIVGPVVLFDRRVWF